MQIIDQLKYKMDEFLSKFSVQLTSIIRIEFIQTCFRSLGQFVIILFTKSQVFA